MNKIIAIIFFLLLSNWLGFSLDEIINSEDIRSSWVIQEEKFLNELPQHTPEKLQSRIILGALVLYKLNNNLAKNLGELVKLEGSQEKAFPNVLHLPLSGKKTLQIQIPALEAETYISGFLKVLSDPDSAQQFDNKMIYFTHLQEYYYKQILLLYLQKNKERVQALLSTSQSFLGILTGGQDTVSIVLRYCFYKSMNLPHDYPHKNDFIMFPLFINSETPNAFRDQSTRIYRELVHLMCADISLELLTDAIEFNKKYQLSIPKNPLETQLSEPAPSPSPTPSLLPFPKPQGGGRFKKVVLVGDGRARIREHLAELGEGMKKKLEERKKKKELKPSESGEGDNPPVSQFEADEEKDHESLLPQVSLWDGAGEKEKDDAEVASAIAVDEGPQTAPGTGKRKRKRNKQKATSDPHTRDEQRSSVLPSLDAKGLSEELVRIKADFEEVKKLAEAQAAELKTLKDKDTTAQAYKLQTTARLADLEKAEKDNKKKKQELEALAKEKDAMEKKFASKVDELKKVGEEKSKLAAQGEDLEKSEAASKAKVKELEEAVKSLEKKNQQLTFQMAKFDEEHRKHLGETGKLQEQLQALITSTASSSKAQEAEEARKTQLEALKLEALKEEHVRVLSQQKAIVTEVLAANADLKRSLAAAEVKTTDSEARRAAEAMSAAEAKARDLEERMQAMLRNVREQDQILRMLAADRDQAYQKADLWRARALQEQQVIYHEQTFVVPVGDVHYPLTYEQIMQLAGQRLSQQQSETRR